MMTLQSHTAIDHTSHLSISSPTTTIVPSPSSISISKPKSISSITSTSSNSIQFSLLSLPPELLDEIAFHVAVPDETALGPPSFLLNVLLTCRHLYTTIGTSLSLYARIFRAQFDYRALTRRFPSDWLTSSTQVNELRRRWIALKRIRAVGMSQARSGSVSEEHWSRYTEATLTCDLWICFMILLESDGLNLEQVRWAYLDYFLEAYFARYMMPRLRQEGYQPESTNSALAIWLSWMVTSEATLKRETHLQATQNIALIRPFVFGCHRYDACFAPWIVHTLPLEATPDTPEPSPRYKPRPNAHPYVAMDVLPRNNAQVIHYLDRKMVISAPLMSHAAIMSFFLRLQKRASKTSVSSVMADGAAAPRFPEVLGGAAPPTEEGTSSASAIVPHPPPSVSTDTDSDFEQGSKEGHFANLADSRNFDIDFNRLIACLNPYVDSCPFERPFFVPGTFSGVWEGRFSFFDFDAFQDMLVGHPPPAAVQPNELMLGQQPQIWRITEYHLYASSAHHIEERRQNAAQSPTSEIGRGAAKSPSRSPAMSTKRWRSPNTVAEDGNPTSSGTSDDTLGANGVSTNKDDPDDAEADDEVLPLPDGPALNAHVPVGARLVEVPGGLEVADPDWDKPIFYKKYTTFSTTSAKPPPVYNSDIGSEDFSLGGQYRPDNTFWDTSHADVSSDPNERVLDTIILGSGHSAWGTFTLRGRVRLWDGLVTVLKYYSGPQGRGTWLYRGYIHGGENWIGRWRDTVTELEYCGYEGVFAMRLRR